MVALQRERVVVETALTVAHRATVRMQSLRLEVSAGKLGVGNLACTHEGRVGCKTTECPGEVAGWGGHGELMWYLQAPNVDVIMR